MKYTKPLDYEEELMRSHETFDVAAADVTYDIAEQIRCLAVLANFSKLFIDPSKPLANKELIRHHYKQLSEDGSPLPVSFNAHGYRLFERLETFYLEYHKILGEVMEFVDPKFIVSIHTHDPE